jgi:hypothetical protein
MNRPVARTLGVALSVAVLFSACGGGKESTPTPTASPKGGASTPARPSATPPVTEAFPGLPLDKITATSYDPERRLMTLTTTLPPGARTEADVICFQFIQVALFAPDATIRVLASDLALMVECHRTPG